MTGVSGLSRTRALFAIHSVLLTAVFVSPALAQQDAALAEIDRTMENYRLDAHIPGMVWAIVQDGRVIHVKGAGVQDIDTKRPVTADTLFRIASMTKAFTALSILKLRDEGSLRWTRRWKRTCRNFGDGSTRPTTRRRSACASC